MAAGVVFMNEKENRAKTFFDQNNALSLALCQRTAKDVLAALKKVRRLPSRVVDIEFVTVTFCAESIGQSVRCRGRGHGVHRRFEGLIRVSRSTVSIPLAPCNL